MQPLHWEYRPDGLRAPALVCAFKGWNDAGDAASAAMTFVGARSAPAVRDDRPRGVLRLPGDAPADQARRGADARQIVWPEVEVYEARVPRAPRDLILLVGPEPSMRWRTFSQRDRRARRGARRAARRHARRAARRRAAHAARSSVTGLASDPALVERLGLQPLLVRGSDRDRRRAARRLPGGRPAVGEPVGGGAALRRRRAEPEGRARARAQARGPRRRGRRRAPSWSRPLPTTSARSASPSRATPTSRRSSSASSRRPRRGGAIEPGPLPSGETSPASSSASCASAATRRHAGAHLPPAQAASPPAGRGPASAPLDARGPTSRRPHSPPPGTRSGSRTSSRPSTTASARTPATRIPSATSNRRLGIQSGGRSSSAATGTFSSSST